MNVKTVINTAVRSRGNVKRLLIKRRGDETMKSWLGREDLSRGGTKIWGWCGSRWDQTTTGQQSWPPTSLRQPRATVILTYKEQAEDGNKKFISIPLHWLKRGPMVRLALPTPVDDGAAQPSWQFKTTPLASRWGVSWYHWVSGGAASLQLGWAAADTVEEVS